MRMLCVSLRTYKTTVKPCNKLVSVYTGQELESCNRPHGYDVLCPWGQVWVAGVYWGTEVVGWRIQRDWGTTGINKETGESSG